MMMVMMTVVMVVVVTVVATTNVGGARSTPSTRPSLPTHEFMFQLVPELRLAAHDAKRQHGEAHHLWRGGGGRGV